MEDEGVGHRDTLVAMMAPAGAGTVAEREAAAAEEGGSEEEEATVASASDSGGSESDPGEGTDSEKENEGGEGPRGARRAGGGASAAWMPTASPRATRTWAGRMRVPVFQRPGAAAPPPAPKRMRPYGVPSATGEEAQKRRRRGERFERERQEQQRGEGQKAQPRWAWDRRRMDGAPGRVVRNDTSSFYANMVKRCEEELAVAQSEERADWLMKKLGGARAMLAQRLREEGEREGADGADAEVVAAVAATEPTTDTTARRFAAHSFGLGRLAMEKEARARRAAEAQATVAAATTRKKKTKRRKKKSGAARRAAKNAAGKDEERGGS